MPNLAQLLTTKSSAEYRRVFDLCRAISGEFDDIDAVYVVGGVVRDLILERAPNDIDISVVGNARGFSEALASGLGVNSPVESQFLTFKINAVDLKLGGSSIDVVTARSETYSEPAALPEIAVSSISDDLKRRDFTINAMALSLSNSNWGNLVDPANGFGDVMRKRIKVLHAGSFVDDPTRIFRAVRYATRLGFSIDSRTSWLMSESLAYVDRLSGTRIRNEFEQLLGESKRTDMLRMSEEMGLIGAMSPGLRIGSKALQVLDSQEELGTLSTDLTDLLAIATFGLNEDEATRVIERFDAPAEWGESITGNTRLAKHVALLDRPNILPSELVEILDQIPLASIRAHIAVGPPLPRRDKLNDYMERIRFIKPDLTGIDLIKAGIPEGPIIGKLICIVKRAKLDGHVRSRQEELELALNRLPGFLTN
ncbi:MAG: CCA tRNA nucleotidyltransferase [Chloroflexi bacterium]|nr:CCA tRNA nucleotidyltransferase [Chloroflexota bacterium]